MCTGAAEGMIQTGAGALLQTARTLKSEALQDDNETALTATKCATFHGYCMHLIPSLPTWTQNWTIMENGFTTCCLGAGHPLTFCKYLSDEAFGSYDPQVVPDLTQSSICDELVNLAEAHFAWVKDHRPALLKTRAENMVTYLAEVSEVTPSLLDTFVDSGKMIAIGTALSTLALRTMNTDTRKAALATMLSAVMNSLEGCDGHPEE